MIEVGDEVKFNYPDYGTPDGHPEHTAHRGQTVTVVGKVPRESFDHADIGEDIFEIRAADGWVAQAYEGELESLEPDAKIAAAAFRP